ncbi:MAG: flavin reductase family protein [candidate division Zixibacteria bacterium]|nr:flavin reductase family protein [candidate division Zixibacteria bacterium]
MVKTNIGPRTDLFPLPTALVSCQDSAGRRNIITISWTGICCSEPPMVSIAIRKNRYSHGIILNANQFGLNLPNEDLTAAMDFCGTNSGRDVDKFEACNLTPAKGIRSKTLLIEECPVSLECSIEHILELGSHDLFIAEIVATHIDKTVVDRSHKYIIDKLKPVAYFPKSREYRGGFTKKLGKTGEFKNKFK